MAKHARIYILAALNRPYHEPGGPQAGDTVVWSIYNIAF